MHKSLLSFAVLSVLTVPTVSFAEEAAVNSSCTVNYNIGLFSQYTFHCLIQTVE